MSFFIPFSDFLNGGLNPNSLTARGATAQNVNVTDLICEGPIRGLVNGEAGLHLDDVAVQDANFRSFTSYQPSGDNQQTFSGDITFSGSSVGTLSDELDISELELDENSPRSITLQNYKLTSVTVTNTIENAGLTTLTLSAASGTPFTTEWNSGEQLSGNAFAIVSLIQDDFSLSGFFFISNSSTAAIMFYGAVPPTTGTFTLVVDYTIPITALDSDNNQLTLAATPASGSYKFVIGAQVTASDNGEVTAGTSSIVSKIDKLNIDFRKGDLYQPVTTSTGGVGGAVAVSGNTGLISGPAELKIISQTLADSLGVTIFDKNGLPNIGGGSDYPGTPDLSVMATSVTTLPSSSFGLDTAVKIKEADEIGFSIKYPALQVINLNAGDKETAYAFYVMQIRFEQNNSYGPWKTLFPGQDYVRHLGNTNAPVSFDHDINLEGYRKIVGPFEDFEVRVFRVTRHIGLPVRISGTNEDDTNKKKWQLSASASIENLRAVIKDHFTYPYSAVASVSYSSRQFDGVPKRSYLLEGKLVKIPSTYTPREYSDTGIAEYEGFWDGEFRDTLFYTDNPAWVFYDIVTNNRYGAGKWIQEADIDKYALYRVARYCDELVDDGSVYNANSSFVIGELYKIKSAGDTSWSSIGSSSDDANTIFRATSTSITGTGTACRVEPRFRANVFLTKATDVYKVLKDFATIFLGILYWQDSKIVAVQDAPQDPVYNFTKGNVIEGAFSYESSGSRTRTNQVVVTWNDPTINYQPVPLVVEDRESIVRSGRIISENAVAFGATSESQAIRYGKWKLWTAQNQTELVSFKTSLAAHYIKPGDVINVQDADRFGISYSGRTSSATSTTLTFDRNVSFNSGSTYELSTLVTEPAALNASEGSITINSVTYQRGEKIDQGYVYDGSSYELVDLDTEERASNAFSDNSGTNLIPTIWKPYTYVETHEITNPGNTTNTVTLANSVTFDITPSKHNIWALKETSGNLNVAGSQKMYKVLSITEESPNTFGVSAVEYFDEKFVAVEEDYALGTIPETIYVEREPVTIPRPINPRVILATDAKKPGEELVLEWDQEESDSIVQYEVLHSIEGIENPIKTNSRQVSFNSVPNGSVTFKVRAISRKGNISSYTAIDYGVYDPYGENVPRMPGGIPKGAISTAQGKINASNEFIFQATNASVSSVTNPFVTYTITGAKNVANIFVDEPYYLYLDTSTPSLKLLEYNSTALSNIQFYRDVGSGNSAISTAWTSIGTVSIAANSNEVTGSGFNTNVKLRDVLNLQNSTSPSGGDGAVVIGIISDTKLLIDRTFGTAKSSITGYRSAFRPDYANDSIFAEITKSGSTISTNNFITLRSSSDDVEGTTETLDDGTIAVKDGGISVDKIAANSITADKIQANTITADQIAANSISANEIAANSITADMITSNSVVSSLITASTIQSSHIKSNSIVSTIIDATTITASNITATNLSALSADLGAVTAGTMQGGTIPDADAAPSGTESGAFLNLTGGKMVFGNSNKYILFDGSDLELNGVTIDASSTINATAAADIEVKEDNTSEGTGIASFNFTTGLNLSVNGTEATISAENQTPSWVPATNPNYLTGITTAQVRTAGALMDDELTDLAGVKGVTISTLQPKPSEGAFANGDKTKLNGISTGADVTPSWVPSTNPNYLTGITTAQVRTAGALMDDELTDLAGVKGVTISTLQTKPSEGAFADGDKTKLDNIEENANAFTLSPATATTLGGVKIGSGININSGVISAATQSDENFTSTLKTKLNNIEENANDYTLPVATTSDLGGVKIGAGINIDNTGAITASTQSDENFTSTLKTKLTNIEANANNYTLPEATSTVLGGVKDGARVTIDANGVLSADVQTANDFTNALKNKLDNIEENANEYSLPVASPTVLGGVKIGSGISISSGTISADTQSDQNFTSTLKTKLDNIEANATADQSASEIRTLLGTATSSTSGLVKIGYTENAKNYPVELSSGQMFVNVPWTDNNTTYTAGSGLSLSGANQFSVDSTVVRTSGAQTIAGNKTFSNNVTVSGNLTVSGTTTYINTQTLNIGDNIITLNADFTGSTPTESAGIEVERGTQANVLFQYKESGVGITGDLAAGWSVGTSRIEATGFYGTFYGDASNLTNINADSLSGLSTADLPEDPSATTTSGTMYYTDTRVIAALSGGSGIDKSAGGEFAVDSTVVRTSGAQTLAGTKTFSNGIVASGGISGLTLTNGISGTNFNITGVNQISINDPGEGILFTAGSSGNMTLAVVDDASDNILRYSGTNAVFDVQGNITLSGTVDGRDLATDGAKLDNIAANATNTAAPAISTNGSTPSLASGITAAEVRSLIGAGTSSLALGTTSTTALRGDTAIPTVNNPAITLSAGNTGITMDSDNSFTLNQSGAETITISHADTSSQESVTNNNGTVIQDITLDTFGHITGIDSIDLDGRYFTETESDARYLRKDSYNSNWTRLGYGTSGTAYWHKLAEVTINGSYKDYQLRCDWTDRYNHGTLNIHIHSDNDNIADIWDAYVQQFGQTNRKASSHFKYYKSGSTVQVWIYTPGWREWDYIRTDAVTEGTPTIVWYKEGDSGAGKTTTEPSGLTEFSDYTPWHLNNDGPSSGLNADTLHGASPSMVAGNSTIVQRNASGYVFANYFNTTANDVSSGVTKIMVETGNDNYIRHGDAGAVRGFINVANGADVTPSWVPSTNPNYLTGITSSQVTTALGFTPYNATNPSGYITGISSGDVTTALGFTPYNATNPSGYITNSGGTTASTANTVVKRDSAGDINARLFRSEFDTTNATIGFIMTQINTGTNNYIRPSTPAQVRLGLNVADGADVTPSWVPSTNPNYLTGITSSQVTTALGFTPYNSTNPSGYITGISSSDVTTALGFTPYNATNPSGYITGISSSDVTTALGFTPYNATNPSGYITNSGGTTAATANTVAKRNGSADIRARLFRSNYANQTTISGAMAFRVNNGTDDYIRFCSDAAAIRTFIGAGTSSTTGTVTSVSGGTGLSGTVTTSGSLNLTNTGVSAATYGNSTNIPQIAVDAQGRITSASNVAVSIPSGANNATITLTAGNGLTTGGSFTTDQSSNDTITFNVGAGDGISVAANAVAVDSTVLRAGTGTLINDIINANVITADMIQANSIVATIITAEEITASHIATNTITANEIQAGAITASELQISNNASGSAGIFMDYNSGNSRIDIRDSSALRVRIGYLA